MPLTPEEIQQIADAVRPASPVVTIPHLPANFPTPKTPSDWVNLFASIAAAIMGVLAVYHQQTVDTPKPPSPPAVVVTPGTPAPAPVDPAIQELRDAIAKINAQLEKVKK